MARIPGETPSNQSDQKVGLTPGQAVELPLEDRPKLPIGATYGALLKNASFGLRRFVSRAKREHKDEHNEVGL